jgi:spore maturation protein CgeB
MGIKTINIYPDCSAFAHGAAHRKAVGAYDLVISTKIYHKDIWHTQYGYTNQCLFVPQGYDPALHLNQSSPSQFRFDVVLIATYREEYGRLIMEFASSLGHNALRVAIGGYGWEALRQNLPRDWTFTGPMQGASYVSLLRSGKICVAPLTRTVIIDGKQHLGDVDTTRTYELPAAHCFFIHQRTDYAMSLYGDAGVPMFDDGVELANQVKLYLNDDAARVQIASAAHRAAVPAHSLDSRAQEIVDIMRREIVT